MILRKMVNQKLIQKKIKNQLVIEETFQIEFNRIQIEKKNIIKNLIRNITIINLLLKQIKI